MFAVEVEDFSILASSASTTRMDYPFYNNPANFLIL